MKEKEFFINYIPALEASLAFKMMHDFDVKGPDWFIKDDELRTELDLFEQENYEKHKSLFDMVAYYLDARAHNFKEIDGVSVEEHKQKLESVIDFYKKEYNL